MNTAEFREMTPVEMARIYRMRPADAHKGTMGHALLMAGRPGMAGCAVLAAESCMRSGAGKLTVYTPEENRQILQISLPEAIVSTSVPLELNKFQAIAIGPGIGTYIDNRLQLMRILQGGWDAILDADALTLVAESGELPGFGHILTPHAGEMERLAKGLKLRGKTLPDQALNLAKRFSSIVILKGHPSLICFPGGTVYSCPRGNAGMATAGSGDVLTGIILGLRAQGYTDGGAALLGTWLHATAGDFAARTLGQECMLASDITRHLPQAFAELLELKQTS